jgi:Predicted amidohydrolase
MRCDPQDIAGNASKIASWLRTCADAGSSLLVLPELSLTAYQPFAEHDRDALKKRVEESQRTLAAETDDTGVDLLIGYPEVTDAGIYIVSAYISRGETVAAHRKTNLCNYLHYTEHLHFLAGDRVTCAQADIAAFGIVVCEDSWHILNAIAATQMGAEVILNPSAASVTGDWKPADCLENWKKVSIGTAFFQTSYFVLCNQAGPTAEGIYMGGSHVVDPRGNLVGTPLGTAETLAHVALDASLLAETRAGRPLVANERMDIYAPYCR